MKKRILSLLLALCAAVLLFSALPVTASAETEGDWEYSVNSGLATVTKYLGSDAIVTIPDKFGVYPVTAIGKSAFEGNATMTMVNFPKGLTSIGNYAFKGCAALTELTLPEKLTHLGGRAFEGCVSLSTITVQSTKLGDVADNYNNVYGQPFLNAGLAADGLTVTFAEGCTRVPARMFQADTNGLTKVILGKDVTEIGTYAFAGCAQLTDLNLGSVVTVNSFAFDSCSALTNITWSEKLDTIAKNAFSNCIALKTVELPKSVTGIGVHAFSGCASLETLTLPEKLTAMGGRAFENCTALTTVTVKSTNLGDVANNYNNSYGQPFNNAGTAGDGITVTFAEGCTRVPANLFQVDNSNLTEVILKGDVTEIGANAFDNSTQLKSVNLGSIVTIGTKAFKDCTALTTFTWSEKLTTIGDSAFIGCSGLTALSLPASLDTISNYAFANCTKLTDIVVPKSVTSIGKYAFTGCTSLTTVTLPEKLTYLGGRAFENCTALTTVTVNCTNLGNVANNYNNSYGQPFENAGTAGDGITVTFAEGCTRVPAQLFQAENINLVSVILGKDVVEIGEKAFDNCKALTTVNLGNVVTIGTNAFKDCAKLTTFTWSEKLTTIGDSAFVNCTGLTTLTLPASVTGLGNYAFSGCTSLTGIDLPKGLTSIGKYAFTNCSALTTITLPEKLTYLGGRAFENCTALTAVTVNSTNLADVANNYNNSYGQPFENAGTAGDGITATFTESCTRVPAQLFQAENNNLTSVILKNGVTDIGEKAFDNCKQLTTVNLGSVVTIGTNAFKDCSALVDILWSEKLDAIGGYGFVNCTALTQVDLPASLTSLGKYAFSGCSKLEVLRLPKGLTSIGDHAFVGCTALTSVTLPEKLTHLGGRAFEGCTALTAVTVNSTSLGDVADNYNNAYGQPFNNAGTAGTGIAVTFGSGCTRIPARIFQADNNNVVSLTVHKDVTEVGSNAFANCLALKTIRFLGANPTIADNAFTGVVANGYHNNWPQEALLDYGGDITWENEGTACTHGETTLVNALAATCTAEGYTGDTLCTACGETVKAGETIPALGHTEETIPAVVPTCKNTGLTEGKKCSVCGTVTVAQETVPTVDHTWDEGQVTEEPTDMEEGEKLFTCTVCQETKTETLPKLDHEHSYSDIVTKPTCTEGGYTTHSCHCGHSYTDSQTQPLGHDWDQGRITTQPTPETDGVKTFTCSRCGQTKTETVPYVPGQQAEIFRIAGIHRFDTAFMVANQMKKNLGVTQFDAIIVASGTNFADALGGSYLAAVKQAPILLSYNEAINDQVKNYILENLAPGGTVYILGGEAAVPKTIEEGLQGVEIKRLAGNDRFGTNLAILEEAGVGNKPILVCTGIDFADSLSCSATELPILLVFRHLTEEQHTFLDGLNGNSLYIIGGKSAVSTELQLEVGAYGPTTRLGGDHRFETSVMIAQTFFENPDSVVLAYAKNFPDGLCGGALASTMKAPLLLTMTKFESYAAEYAEGADITDGVVLGGTGLISDEAVRTILRMK